MLRSNFDNLRYHNRHLPEIFAIFMYIPLFTLSHLFDNTTMTL